MIANNVVIFLIYSALIGRMSVEDRQLDFKIAGAKALTVA